jgi:hypothetical protein
MNAERILKLADVIEGLPHGTVDWASSIGELSAFNMSEWNCGTVGCIAGWTIKVFSKADDSTHYTTEARSLLGLSSEEAEGLFTPRCRDVEDYRRVKPTQAAAVLRHLVATGEVDWSVAS